MRKKKRLNLKNGWPPTLKLENKYGFMLLVVAYILRLLLSYMVYKITRETLGFGDIES
jgi:hypothetical protein